MALNKQAYLTLMRITSSCCPLDGSYRLSFPKCGIDTSNLNKPVRESVSMYRIDIAKDDLTKIVHSIIVGILQDGSTIMAEVASYNGVSRKLGLLLRSPKKHYHFYGVRSFAALYRVPLWIREERTTKEERKIQKVKPQRIKKIKDEGPSLFE